MKQAKLITEINCGAHYLCYQNNRIFSSLCHTSRIHFLDENRTLTCLARANGAGSDWLAISAGVIVENGVYVAQHNFIQHYSLDGQNIGCVKNMWDWMLNSTIRATNLAWCDKSNQVLIRNSRNGFAVMSFDGKFINHQPMDLGSPFGLAFANDLIYLGGYKEGTSEAQINVSSLEGKTVRKWTVDGHSEIWDLTIAKNSLYTLTSEGLVVSDLEGKNQYELELDLPVSAWTFANGNIFVSGGSSVKLWDVK